jgi:hypothetical protein
MSSYKELMKFLFLLVGLIKPLVYAFVVDKGDFLQMPKIFKTQSNKFWRDAFMEAIKDIGP